MLYFVLGLAAGALIVHALHWRHRFRENVARAESGDLSVLIFPDWLGRPKPAPLSNPDHYGSNGAKIVSDSSEQ